MVASRWQPAIVAALLAAAAASRAQERMDDPCADDVARLCPDARLGRVVGCLRENESRLSPACRAKLDADVERATAVIRQFGRACRADVAQLCGNVEPGGGRILDCLEEHLPELSNPCQALMTRTTAARAQVAAVTSSCRGDIARLCPGVPARAGPVIQCLEAHQQELSPDCSAAGVRRVVRAATLLDVLEEMTGQDRIQESLQILQGLDSVAFARSQVLLQFDSYQSLGNKGNGGRMLFNPQFVFGERNQFALQVKVPVTALYPYAAGAPSQFGLGAVSTALAWNFLGTGQTRHYLALGVQWETASTPSIGGPWAVVPSYAVGAALARWVSITTQVQWIRSLGSSGTYPEVNLLILEPILAVNLPGRSFLALDTRLGWDVANDGFVPIVKGVAGIFTERQKSLSISAWYQAALSRFASDRYFEYAVGMGLAYFFDW